MRRASTARTAACDVDALLDERFTYHWTPKRPPPGWKPEGCRVRKYTRTEVDARYGARTWYVEERR